MRNSFDRLGLEAQNKDTQESPVAPNGSAGLLNFVTPTEFVELPSKGKLYPVGHPLKDKEFIEIKEMTAKEEDILTSKALAKKGATLDRFISSVLIDKTIDAETLLSGDRQAIILAARISGYGADYETEVVCPFCDKKQRHVFNLLEKLPHLGGESEQEVSFKITEKGTVIVELPSTKWRVELKALTGKEEKILASFVQNNKAKEKADTFIVDQLKLMILSIQEITDRKTIEEAISVMPAKDSRFLRQTYNKLMPAIDLNHSFECKECGLDTQLEVPLNADFFWVK